MPSASHTSQTTKSPISEPGWIWLCGLHAECVGRTPSIEFLVATKRSICHSVMAVLI
jgi:hypothetical protein